MVLPPGGGGAARGGAPARLPGDNGSMDESHAERPAPRSVPLDPNLAAIAEAMESARGASFLYDRDVTLVWVSAELRKLLGDPSDDDLGIGRHVIEAYMSPVWASRITVE